MKKVIILIVMLLVLSTALMAEIVWKNGFKYEHSEFYVSGYGMADRYIYAGTRLVQAGEALEETFDLYISWGDPQDVDGETYYGAYDVKTGSQAIVSFQAVSTRVTIIVMIYQ